METLSLERLASRWYDFSDYTTERLDISYAPLQASRPALPSDAITNYTWDSQNNNPPDRVRRSRHPHLLHRNAPPRPRPRKLNHPARSISRPSPQTPGNQDDS